MSDIDSAAVGVVEDAEADIESAIEDISVDDASSGDILEATCDINDATNTASAATSATQKSQQLEEAAVATLR